MNGGGVSIADALRPAERWVHLCVDMQQIFAEGGLWATPWMRKVLPNIVRIAERNPARTIFTRFLTPPSFEQASGAWRLYYRKWHAATRNEIDPQMLHLVPPLAALCPPATVVDKIHYSAFVQTSLLQELQARDARGIVVTGSETDVCVLSTVMSAIDVGIPVAIVEDGICSSSDAGHDALIKTYSNRFSCQMSVLKTEALLELWC